MRIDDLKNVHQARPYRPFTIHLSDGRSFRVDHPEFLALSRTGRTVALFSEDDAFEIIDVMLMTSIEVVNGQKGRHARRRT